MPTIGEEIGPYRLLKVLGSGGQGAVYLAERVGSDHISTRLALKLLPAFPEHGEVAERRFRDFLHEAFLLTRMHHPHIVTVFEVTRLRGFPCIVMEYVEGESLEQKVSRRSEERRPFSVSRALRIVTQAATALHYAHGLTGEDGLPLGVVHRDIKPGNILLGPDGSVKLTDFGLARSTSDIHRTTEQGILKGTVKFMSPEQVDIAEVGPATDLYSLGVVLFELVTLDNPYGLSPAAGVTQWVMGIARGEGEVQRRVAAVEEWCPPLAGVLRRCLAYQPQERYPSALALMEDLYRVARLVEEGVHSPPERVPVPPPPRPDSLAQVLPRVESSEERVRTIHMGVASIVELATQVSEAHHAPPAPPTESLRSTAATPAAPQVGSSRRPGWLLPLVMGVVGVGVGIALMRGGAPPSPAAPAPTAAPVSAPTPAPVAAAQVEATPLPPPPLPGPSPREARTKVGGGRPLPAATQVAQDTPPPSTPPPAVVGLPLGELVVAGVPAALVEVAGVSWGEASAIDPARKKLPAGPVTLVGRDQVTGEVVFRRQVVLAAGGLVRCRWDGGERWRWEEGKVVLKSLDCQEGADGSGR